MNFQGDVATTETDIFTSPANRRTIVTGIRLMNQGSPDIYGEILLNNSPIFIGNVEGKDGIYDKDTRIEVLPNQKISCKGQAAGLKYCITCVEVDN